MLDVVVANQNGPLLVYKNTVAPDNQWIEFRAGRAGAATAAPSARRCACTGTASSRCRRFRAAAVSARRTQRRLHFGLGKNPRVEKAVIRWPSGKVQTIEAPAIDQLHTVKEPA